MVSWQISVRSKLAEWFELGLTANHKQDSKLKKTQFYQKSKQKIKKCI